MLTHIDNVCHIEMLTSLLADLVRSVIVLLSHDLRGRNIFFFLVLGGSLELVGIKEVD